MDLTTIEVEDRKHRPVIDRVDKGIGKPASHQWACFCFPVTNDSRCDGIWIVQDGAGCVGEGVAQFSPFMDGTWGFRSSVGSDTAWEGEDFAEFFETCLGLRDIWKELCIGSI